MNDVLLHFMILCFMCSVHIVSCGDVYPYGNRLNLTGIYNTTLKFGWQIVINPNDNFIGFILKLQDIMNIGSLAELPNTKGEQYFGSRLRGVYNQKEHKVDLELQALVYNDTHVFTITVFFQDVLRQSVYSKESTVRIVAINGPPLFQLNSPTHLQLSEEFETRFNVTVSGFPMPLLSWRIGLHTTQNIRGERISTAPIYQYEVRVPGMNRNICGLNFTLTATGYNNKSAEINLRTAMKFRPSRVLENDVTVYHHYDCPIVSWQEEITGHCKLWYNINLFDGNKTENHTIKTNEYNVCFARHNFASHIQIWPFYKGLEGQKSVKISLARKNALYGETSKKNKIVVGVVVLIIAVLCVAVLLVLLFKYKQGLRKRKGCEKGNEGKLDLLKKAPPREPQVKGGTSGGKIAGIVVGVFILIVIIVISIVWYLRWRSQNKSTRRPEKFDDASVKLRNGEEDKVVYPIVPV